MMDPLLMIGAVTVAGVLIGGGVHFLPVGGAPAAIATATGVGTGTAMLAAGSAMTVSYTHLLYRSKCSRRGCCQCMQL